MSFAGTSFSRAIRICGALAALWLLAGPADAQESSPSVAEAARRARAQKKQAAKAARDWNNDTIGSAAGSAGETSSDLGAAPGSSPAGPAGSKAAVADEAKEKERTDAENEVQTATEAVTARKKELELLQRDANLKRSQVYSSPDPKSDPAGRSDLDSLNAQAEAKKTELQQAEEKLADAKAKLEQLNAELGPKPPRQLSDAEQRNEWAGRLRPLRDELARVETEISRLQSEQVSTANISNAQPPPLLTGVVGASQNTGARLADLQKRRDDLRRQIAEIEDEARRAGVPSEWVR